MLKCVFEASVARAVNFKHASGAISHRQWTSKERARRMKQEKFSKLINTRVRTKAARVAFIHHSRRRRKIFELIPCLGNPNVVDAFSPGIKWNMNWLFALGLSTEREHRARHRFAKL